MALTLSSICLNLLLLQWLNCNTEGNGLIPLNEFTLLLGALYLAIALQTCFYLLFALNIQLLRLVVWVGCSKLWVGGLFVVAGGILWCPQNRLLVGWISLLLTHK